LNHLGIKLDLLDKVTFLHHIRDKMQEKYDIARRSWDGGKDGGKRDP
jgi:hypothetical protein